MAESRASWSGHLSFILAAAASAIGLGNLWRFPYLAAQYGGGAFIAVYVALSLTLGFTLLVTEIAIGRKSRQSQLTAFSLLGGRRWAWVGILSTVVPFLISPYYAVIGGWVVKYLAHYAVAAATGAPAIADPSRYFDAFVASGVWPSVFMAFFIVMTIAIIMLGVKNGIEKVNSVMMPLLFLTALGLAVYIMFLPGAAAGIKYYLVPDFSRAGPGGLGKIFLGAMGQMFFSLSLAMGIMVTYGSYMRRDSSIPHAAVRIALADTFIAILSGFMVIPVVHAFAVSRGIDPETALKAGPGLLFKSLPEIFGTFGPVGNILALAFFSLVFFAALTSAISMSEACVAAICDYLGCRRRPAAFWFGVFCVLTGLMSALSMRTLSFVDSVVNCALMPVAAIGIALFAGWSHGPGAIMDELEAHGAKMRFSRAFSIALRYFAPLLVTAILVSEICRVLGIGGWSI